MDGSAPSAPALQAVWRAAGLPEAALACADLGGDAPVLPSSFAVATAAQASLGAAALAAAELWHLRSGGSQRQQVTVDRTHATLDSCAHLLLDGRQLPAWDPISGLYACGPDGEAGWVRIHANFAHHRDGALRLLGLPPGEATGRPAVQQALRGWSAEAFEAEAAQAGLVVAAARSFEQWDAHPQGQAVAAQPLVRITRIEPAGQAAPALPWPALGDGAQPLAGLRVLELTRILAGPVAGRTLAAYGADVMLVNSPSLPNIAAIADTSRGKRSVHVDLMDEPGRARLRQLAAQAHVFLQGYRPGALGAFGLAPEDLARLRPGIVVVSLSAYGAEGPWGGRRGFDSLVQTATGFNLAEAQAAGAHTPRALPLQILDYAAGYLLAFGTQAALWRQQQQGGSWHVQVSLAGVGHWLRSLGRVPDGLQAQAPAFDPYLITEPSGFGALTVLRHPAQFSHTPAGWRRPSMPPGSHPPVW